MAEPQGYEIRVDTDTERIWLAVRSTKKADALLRARAWVCNRGEDPSRVLVTSEIKGYHVAAPPIHVLWRRPQEAQP